MTTASITHQSTSIERRSTGRPPGIHSPGVFWLVVYVGSMCGLAIDATLAASVVGTVFNLPTMGTYAFLAVIGIVVALAATKAASWYNSGYRGRAAAALVGVAAVGLFLAWLRLSEGVAGAAQIDSAAFGVTAPTGSSEDLPATALMLGVYAVSAMSVYLTALKIFVPARRELRLFDAERQVAVERLGQLEGEEVAVKERLAYRDEMARQLDTQRENALAEAEAREAHLKAHARDAIARAVGRPDATPLVRAPHDPATPGIRAEDTPGDDE
jgi:hypothetical protein